MGLGPRERVRGGEQLGLGLGHLRLHLPLGVDVRLRLERVRSTQLLQTRLQVHAQASAQGGGAGGRQQRGRILQRACLPNGTVDRLPGNGDSTNQLAKC